MLRLPLAVEHASFITSQEVGHLSMVTFLDIGLHIRSLGILKEKSIYSNGSAISSG
jgi:hypothetical protein